MYAQIEIQLPGHDRVVGWAPVATDGLGSAVTTDGLLAVIIDRTVHRVPLEDLYQLAETAPAGNIISFKAKRDELYGNPSAQYARSLVQGLTTETDRRQLYSHAAVRAKLLELPSTAGQLYVQIDRTALDGTERGGRLWQHLPIVGARVDEYGDIILVATELKNTSKVSI